MKWNKIRPIIKQILENSGDYKGIPCFLTAYQIAVLADKEIKPKTLDVGGAGIGVHTGLAQQIARQLSADSESSETNKREYGNRLEKQFLSIKGLDSFTFDGGQVPSADEFSMFRLRNKQR